ncbi:transglutaminase family protein [Gordonia sp. TBRC 11910]|uniref:Transglutaminase family protein n=1 Tax=Gordonia asplenii TaxID=2725283 RepID=A0A848L3P5_9ACTN|nr:transglutaminase family protein [Gordonia asplenii]NMO05052.1 transglutaminase family protein [Gordonia asplenii]
MTIKVALEHRTTYHFDRVTKVFPHVLRLRPAPHSRTPIEAYSLKVTPADHFLNWQQDAFSNYLARLVFPEPTSELSFTVGLVADLTAINPFDFFIEDWAEYVGFTYPEELRRDLEVYLRPVDADGADPLVDKWVANHRATGKIRVIDYLMDLIGALRDDVGYTVRMEAGVQEPNHTLESAIGSCRDSAWLLVSILRKLGLAARFVSGYLVQLTSDVKAIDGPSGPDADFTDLHAWTEVYLPGAGWVGMDPTSGLFAGEGHIPLAATPYPGAAAPITGATGKCHAVLDFSNEVTRFHEDPRVTLPYTDDQWSKITVLGADLDERMRVNDVRLTVGGEPTFVSLYNQTDPEWLTDADGPHKRELASQLTTRLKKIYAPTGLVQRGQGKWYPGEPLPRWQVDLLWRADGKALWRNPELLDDPWTTREAAQATIDRQSPGGLGPDDPATSVASHDFIAALADRLALPDSQVMGAYEDPLLRLAELVSLPVGVPPAREETATEAAEQDLTPQTDVPDRRKELLAELDSSVSTPTAYVLPISKAPDGGWRSARWTTRRGRLVLTPGNSPAGLRLPLDSLFWEPNTQFFPADASAVAIEPLADLTELPDFPPPPDAAEEAAAQRLSDADGDATTTRGMAGETLPTTRRPGVDGEPLWITPELQKAREATARAEAQARATAEAQVAADAAAAPLEVVSPEAVLPDDRLRNEPTGSDITALVAEERAGVLYVFLPPTESGDDFAELVNLVERTAAELDRPVVVEGYGPPSDPRLTTLTITPDPGVIEVNIPPTSSFAEQSELLETLYDQARRCGLGTESFDLDGSHGGTGGGNHITLGGARPVDSPLLRRPDLLVSMLSYWQLHPSLSYLFSGRFIGTTSQAPRVDEGRESALYELEIAFAEIDRVGAEVAAGNTDYHVPWTTDRALRHLLTDITGNTHRAEFCIDKLYSPDSTRGRLGLLELRGFEMPPHHQMAMVQSLLVRSLVSWFWDTPYRQRLHRHGADLHGRHLLPHYVIEDIGYVAEDLREAGYDFDTAWLAPFTEFRFPRLGTVAIRDTEIELRGAIEPWNVLGEESTSGGTARYVDSSVERVQVRVLGGDRERFVLTCNGIPVPLTGTGRAGEAVAGIRFRAWQPPSALHPTITVDSPLKFDLVDTHNGRSVGGATYHVVHPGGRSYDVPPVNAVEAESRRNGRFEAAGHHVGTVDTARLREYQARLATDSGVPMILDMRRARTVLR